MSKNANKNLENEDEKTSESSVTVEENEDEKTSESSVTVEEKKDKNSKYLEPKQYEGENFDKIHLKQIIKGQFKKCKIEELVLENIKTMRSPFLSCEIKKVTFKDSFPYGIETHGVFFGQKVEEVTIPKQYEKIFKDKQRKMFGNIKKIIIT